MSDTKTCPACGATLPVVAAFCTTCGQAQATLGPTSPAPGDPATGTPATAMLAPRWQVPDAPPAGGSWTQPPGTWSSSSPTTVQPPVAVPPPAPAPRGSLIGGIVALLGGLFVVTGIFSPWISGNVDGSSITGWGLTSGDQALTLPTDRILVFSSKDPLALLLLGIAGLLIGVLFISGRSQNLIRLAAVAVGVAVLVLLVVDWISMARLVSDQAPRSFELAAEPGFYLALGGGILIGLSALFSTRKVPV